MKIMYRTQIVGGGITSYVCIKKNNATGLNPYGIKVLYIVKTTA